MSGSSRTSKTSLLSPQGMTVATVALAVVLFLALNVFSNTVVTGARVDLTQNGLFTLSQGTRNILSSLKEPVRLRFFYSETVAAEYVQINAYAQRVQDLLEEYEARSGGMVTLEVIDPEPFTDAEDQATALGLQGVPTQSGDLLFFGLVGTNAIDGREVMPFFQQERAAFLEYDLSEMVHRLNTPVRPVLGIVSSLPLETGPGGMQMAMQGLSRPFVIYEQLRERFEVEMLGDGFEAVPAGVDVLMIAHPGDLAPTSLYAIDQFVLRGGRALVFVDPYSEVGGQRGPMGQPVPGSNDQSDLALLFGSWGIAYDSGKVVGDLPAAQPVAADVGGRRVRTSYPVWLGLTQANMAADDLVTAMVGQLNLASAGVLSAVDGAGTTFQPLITTSADSMLYDRFQVVTMPAPDMLLRQFSPTPERYVLGARVNGMVSSAFPAGPPAGEGEAVSEAAQMAHLGGSLEPINVIVVADSDIFDDRLWVQEQNMFGMRMAVPLADNGSLVINAVENLMGSSDLISLRTRASGERPFTVVDGLRRRAESRFLEQEQRLSQELQDAERRLAELQGERQGLAPGASALLSPEEEQLVSQFRTRMIDIRRELRDVQRSLRADIEALGHWLAFFNIAFVPLLIAAIGVGLAAWRRRDRTAHHARGSGQ